LNVGQAFPATLPSAAEGGRLYAEHCAACHGDEGNGGGPMTPQLPGPVPDFSSPDLARTTPPQAWFMTVTQGRLDMLMPPFADSLTEAERWDLVAFLYTLSTPQQQIDEGKAIYEAECARCHGPGGAGDGPDAPALDTPHPDFSDLAYMAARTQSEFFSAVTDGAGEAMPAFQAALTEDQRWAALDYVRAFSYAYAAPGAPVPTLTGSVLGSVINGTNGASVPAGLEVTLHGFDDINLITTLTATVGADGTFAFEAVPYTGDRQFLVTASYRNITYGSEVQSFAGGQDTMDIILHIYDATTEAAAIRVERFHMFVEFTAENQVTIGELFILSNQGDRTVHAPDGSPSIRFALPPGAEDVTMQDGQEGADFVRTAEGLGLLGPVLPGSSTGQVLFSFSLPYDRNLQFAQPMPYPVDVANILVSDLAVSLTGDGWQDLGPQEFQGSEFQAFSQANLAAGEALAFRLTGQPRGASALRLADTDTASLAVGLGAVGVVVLGIGYWWYRRTRSQSEKPLRREDLLQAMAELDDAHDAGEVSEHEYRRERAWLKAQVKSMWE
jgi:mono/diheme cytochrome c family protein